MRETQPVTRRQRSLPVAAILLLMAVGCALLLGLPGRTVATKYLYDLFIFLDGAHRIVAGQVPSLDFHTALGPLTFYIPAAGAWLSGHLGGAMPTGMALLILALAPAIAHVLASRLQAVIALPFGAFLLLVLAAPVNLGESVTSLSFAMFYNRIGWAALAVLLVMYLQPREGRRRDWADAACGALLTLVMAYTKATYGLVALAFLGFLLLADPRQRRWAGLALGLTLVSAILVELAWGGTRAHIEDLVLANKVSGTRTFHDLALGFLRHLADYVLVAILVGFALRRTRSMRDLLFFGFCAGPGLLIMSQNAQPWGIVTLHAGAAVAAEMLLRPRGSAGSMPAGDGPPPAVRTGFAPNGLAAGTPLLLLALLLPTAVHCAIGLGLHAGLAAARAGESIGMPGYEGVRLVRLWSETDQHFSAQYLTSLRDGAEALASLDAPSRVSVLDFVSPFSAGLGLEPPRGDSAWLHWGRNVDEAHFIPPEQLFRDVRILMVPKWGIYNVPLIGLYGEAVERSFEPVRETEFWTVHSRRAQPEVR